MTRRLVVVALLAGGIAAAWRWRGLFDPVGLTGLIDDNPLAPLVFIVVHIAASLFFVPRTLLAVGAGLVFGMWWGVVWAAVGSVCGAVAGFLAARYIRSGVVERAWLTKSAGPGRLTAVLQRVERGGWRGVALLRLVPIVPASLTNYALGLTRLSVGAYAFGTLLGQLPLTIAYADLGAVGAGAWFGAGDWRYDVLWPSLIGLMALTVSLLIPVVMRRRLRQGQPIPGA